MTHRPLGEPAHRPLGEPPRPVRPHPVEAALGRPPRPADVDPAVLGALLHRHGWQRRGGAAGRYGRWTPPGPGGAGTSLLVPVSRAFPDSDDLLAEALDALTRCGTPAAREVLLALTVPSDEVHWWRDAPDGPAGAASWNAEEHLRGAARQTLLAAALATRARAGYHGARHRRAAAACLEHVLVGSAAGGRSLTALVPVASGRALTVRLHQALYAVREAVDYRRATGTMDAFDGAVRAGASRELTEALIALVRGTEGARIAVEWAPAAGVPADCAAGAVEFSPGDLPVLREAGARYLRAEPSVPVRITGAVVRLRRAQPHGEGTARLRVIAGADVPYVRVTLREEDYRVAGHAHLVGLPVRVLGRLESRGGFRRLTGACEVVPVPVDDEERDRLMKALREEGAEADFFARERAEDDGR
ncbi:hypothetical protein H1R13_29395 [Streptomyces mexicanus]|uniref:Uncharacterized protein n=1 Tax=Streptomyces mexicanus TaxID=178566 RepID=A0A7X1LTN0_9ACTN|nr:hypothetical protein [Streptomyces mexicanus]MBC2868927.1 hypothetical protein [Streptomyces mexicanus]